MSARAGVGALGVALLAVLIFLAVSSWSRQPAVATPSSQPINFPHNVHDVSRMEVYIKKNW